MKLLTDEKYMYFKNRIEKTLYRHSLASRITVVLDEYDGTLRFGHVPLPCSSDELFRISEAMEDLSDIMFEIEECLNAAEIRLLKQSKEDDDE